MRKWIKDILTSMVSYVGLLIYTKILFNGYSYNFLIFLAYFALLYFYNKFTIKPNKRLSIIAFILSVLLSLMLSTGSVIKPYLYESATTLFTPKNILYCIISIVGLTALIYKLAILFFTKIEKIKVSCENNQKMTKKQFFISVLIIMCGYTLYFIRFYPAIMTSDSHYVIHYANSFILSDFHTFGHTWFFGIFFHLGKFLFNNINAAVALSIIVQMITLSSIFTYMIKYLYNKGVNKIICLIVLLFFTLNPLHAHFSVTLWRDVLFGASFILILISLHEFISNDNKIRLIHIITFIIGNIMLLFFRNNGIYVFVFSIPFIIFMIKKHRRLVTILSFSILSFYIVIKGPVFDYFNVAKTKTTEAYSIPLQQMARTITLGKVGNERKFLEELFEYNKVATSYRGIISDPIKNITNGKVIEDKTNEFFKTYLSLLVKNPQIYIEAYMMQTIGYWYPDIIYWATGGESEPIFEVDATSEPLTPEIYNKLIDSTTNRNLPFAFVIWSIGFEFILLLISTFILIYKRKTKYIVCYIPLIGLWISIMLSTPVYSELRYVYGLFTCMPLFVLFSLMHNQEQKKENIQEANKKKGEQNMKQYLKRIYSKSQEEYFKELKKKLNKEEKQFIITVNPESLMNASKDKELDTMLLDKEVSLVPDGIAVVKACQMLKLPVEQRITGVDIAEYLLEEGHKQKKSIYLFGSKQEVLDAMENVIKEKYPNLKIAGMTNGYVEDKDAVFKKIKKAKPDICLVALGIPAQEKLIYKHLDEFDKGIFVGVGGSLDVLSGTKKRAPKLFIKLNLEWLYRIAKEPKRLKRFWDNNVKFIFEVKKQK